MIFSLCYDIMLTWPHIFQSALSKIKCSIFPGVNDTLGGQRLIWWQGDNVFLFETINHVSTNESDIFIDLLINLCICCCRFSCM